MEELGYPRDIVGADGAYRDRGRLPHDASLRAMVRGSRVTDGTPERVHGICFHGIGTPRRTLEPGEDRYWVTVDDFRAMLDVIAATPGVRITFDDGNASDLELGLDGLRERDLSASFFVLAGRLGSRGSLDADGLRELVRSGMTVGTHGMDHRPWRRLSAPDREYELVEARATIADVIGRPVDEAAVPFGLYDRRLLADLRRLDYAKVHTSDGGLAHSNAWLQPRVSVTAADTAQALRTRLLAPPSRTRRVQASVKGALRRLR
jgi:peptidoglycan/xylan/chitin deacetylase (PgdA/CDA1 family)